MQKNTIKPFLRFAAFFFFLTLRTLSSAAVTLTVSRTGSGFTRAAAFGAAAFWGAGLAFACVGAAVCLVDFELNIFMENAFFLLGVVIRRFIYKNVPYYAAFPYTHALGR